MKRTVVLVLLALGAESSAQERAREPRAGGERRESPDELDDSWSAEVGASLQRAEYQFSALGPNVFSAPNRAQELRSRVSDEGLEVFSRSVSADGEGVPWRLRLRTKSFGRVDGTIELGHAALSVREERVELDQGRLLEWLENRAEGIEQGWTIPARPSGAEPLWIGLEIGGELSLRIEEGARSGVFVDAAGELRLRYTGLMAFDATGRELEAHLAPSPEGVGISIDDAGAVYPLTVDPVLTGPAWTAEGDQASALFGYSVAAAGDVNGDGYSDVLVGSFLYDNGQIDEGRALVYMGSASGLSPSPAWTAESDQAGASFGNPVATAGDVNGDGYSDVIVGAHKYDNGESDEGRAFLYLGSSSGLSTSAAWTAESDQTDAQFGYSVACAGDVNGDGYSDVIVGAVAYDNGETDEGRAFTYLGSASGLATSPAWMTEGDQASALFGFSVATAGDVNGDGYSDVIVGAYLYDNGELDEGRAFAYLGSASGLATSPAWTAESNQLDARVSSVASAGDVNGDGYSDVIIGHTAYDNGQTNEGRAAAYLGSATGLATSPAWTAESDQASADFGLSVSSAGDVNGDGYSDVIVGAYTYDNGQTDEGGAFVYLGSGAGLSTSPAWTAESDQAVSSFGITVSSAGDVNGDGYSDVIVGAYGYDNGQTDEGRAFVYHGSASGLATGAAWTAESNQFDARFGFSLSTAGDVNGDGYSDVIVGAFVYDSGSAGEGRAFLYLGTLNGLSTSSSWTADGDQADAQFGYSVSNAGDINGDGYGDVIVGAVSYDNVQVNEGRAFVYQGAVGGLSLGAAWVAESDQTSASFGYSVQSAGDVNGDGYSDVIVGADLYDNGQTDEGRASVYLGSASGLTTSPVWTAETDQSSSRFGASVSTAGDVNADGYSDVIVGALAYTNGEPFEGKAFVYLGSANGLSTSPAWAAESDQASASFGFSVSTAGDVNGDGHSDVIVGACRYDNGATDEGRAFTYWGSASGLSTNPAWIAESDLANAQFGFSVSNAGDVNGDGYSDVIVGAVGYDNGETDEGRAFTYLGSASGLATSPAWTAESDQASALFGYSVSSAGDVNGDGYGDVIVGAPSYTNGSSEEGRTFVYLGNDGRGGLVRTLQQRRNNDAAPIALLGGTGSNGLFRIQAQFAKNPGGFSWASPTPTAYFEWETKLLGVSFDGTSIERSPGQSLEPAGGMLTFNELTVATYERAHARYTKAFSYHWRARIATNNPLFPHTAWFSFPENNITEAKLRKPAVPLH